MTLAEEFRSRNFSIYGQWFVNIYFPSPYVLCIPYHIRPRAHRSNSSSCYCPSPWHTIWNLWSTFALEESRPNYPVERDFSPLDAIALLFLTRHSRICKFTDYKPYRTGVLCIILCFALGIANIFSFNALRIVFSIVCLICSFLIIFIEIPFLLRICPTSSKFDAFIRRFTTIWMRAVVYLAMSIVQWMSLFSGASSLIAAAVFLLIASLFYALAGLKSQEFVGSKTLGGQGLVQMIV
ncbi:hypothetical protein DTO207G8_3522 [Paecilomyces variotii]|nr:hypothetical protein DTO207G8_3522 [Paecilomyces variotii]